MGIGESAHTQAGVGGVAYQNTIGREIHLSGVGLHTGKPVNLTLCPAPAESGIRFLVTPPDGGAPEVIAAAPESVVDTAYATTLGNGRVTLYTVEHLLSALAGLGIDNADIHLDGPEVPVMDGSAAPFVEAVLEAGIVTQKAPRQVIRVTAPIRVEDGDKWIELLPVEGGRTVVDYHIAFAHPAVGRQHCRFELSRAGFVRDLASARTFGFMHEVAALQAAGLARGGSTENAVVFGEEEVISPGGLRYDDEPVRHKVLDLIGDLSLSGRPIRAHIVAHRSGHTLNALALQTLLAREQDWELVTDTAPATRTASATVAA